jgi:hypothetical protein
VIDVSEGNQLLEAFVKAVGEAMQAMIDLKRHLRAHPHVANVSSDWRFFPAGTFSMRVDTCLSAGLEVSWSLGLPWSARS